MKSHVLCKNLGQSRKADSLKVGYKVLLYFFIHSNWRILLRSSSATFLSSCHSFYSVAFLKFYKIIILPLLVSKFCVLDNLLVKYRVE